MILNLHDRHLRSIDLNLLPVLDALLRHRNATRAGLEVGLSQPAMSRALARLRHLLGDPLLVRGPGKSLLTPRAETLQTSLGPVLCELRDLLVSSPFNAANERRTVRIAMTDAQASLLLSSLVARVVREAPAVVIEWVPIGPNIAEKMQAGEIDLVLALDTTPLPRGAASAPLMHDRLATVVRQGHPSAWRWQIEDYARYPSVLVSLLGDGSSELDAELASYGIERPIAAIVPSFRAAAELVALSDAVTTISRAFAQNLVMPLVLMDPPINNTKLNSVVVWSRHRGSDPLIGWLRTLMFEIVNTSIMTDESCA